MQPIRVVLVENHELFRAGLHSLLDHEGIDVVGEAGAGSEAVELIVAESPDVVVADVALPGRSGIEVARETRDRSPGSRVLILSISEYEGDIADAFAAGASGYLLKDSAVEEIADGIRAASRGEPALSRRIASRVLERLPPEPAAGDPGDPGEAGAIARERRILELLAAGREARSAAGELGLPVGAVAADLARALARIPTASSPER
ncbi:MAG TPA: response regulator transcription factor [Solirubrobacterales bacterium]|nr:response regulator transcription factor [Solirubrobacterales bacterium]